MRVVEFGSYHQRVQDLVLALEGFGVGFGSYTAQQCVQGLVLTFEEFGVGFRSVVFSLSESAKPRISV